MRQMIVILSFFLFTGCNALVLFGIETDAKDGFFTDYGGNGHYLQDACSLENGSCEFWFDAADTSTYFDTDITCTNVAGYGDPARCWKNKGSVSSENFTKGGGFAGVYNAANINAQGSLYIRGTGNNEYASLNIDPLTDQTWFIVVQLDTNPPAERFIFGNAGTGDILRTGISAQAGPSLTAYLGGATRNNVTTAISIGQPYVLSLRFVAGDMYFYVDGIQQGSSIVGGTPDPTHIFALAALQSDINTGGADIYVGEFVVYNRSTSESEHTEVVDLLKNKWGI